MRHSGGVISQVGGAHAQVEPPARWQDTERGHVVSREVSRDSLRRVEEAIEALSQAVRDQGVALSLLRDLHDRMRDQLDHPEKAQVAHASAADFPNPGRVPIPAPRERPGESIDTGVSRRKALTCREREVLTLLGRGLTNPGIADRLGISRHTVKAHLHAIFGKLEVRDRTEAVLVALHRGLISADDLGP